MVNNAILDNDTIAELKTVLEDGFEGLINTFFQSSDEILIQLKTQMSALSNEEIADLSHALKGSSKNIGATRLAEASLALEFAAKQGNSDTFIPLISDIEECYLSTKHALLRVIEDS